MPHRFALLTATAGATLVASAQATSLPPAGSGCGESGPTQSETRPIASLASKTLTLRDTGRVRLLVRGNQTAAATVSITQDGGRRVGGTDAGQYTCTTPEKGRVSLPLNGYGRALVRRHGKLPVRLSVHLVNGSGVRNTVRLSGLIQPE